MRPAEDETSEFVADALECLKIKFVNNVEDVNNKDPKYPIEFAYVKFGDLEKIYGYKDLSLTLCYTEATMFPHLISEYSEEVKGKGTVPDDIFAKMEIELVEDQKKSLRSVEAFQRKIEEQSKFQPFGTQIPHFVDEEKMGKKFALFRLEGELTEEEKLYLERIQSILFFYIEKAQYTDSDDDRFTYYVLYETFHQPGITGTQYRIAGYMSYYKYYWHPDQWRLRNAHTFVFPQFRSIGIGSRFLHAINCDLRNMNKVYDATAETPAPGYIAARDYTSVLELIELPEFAKDKILNEPFTSEKAEVARQKWKMYKGAARRAHDILHLAIAERKGTEELEEFKKLLVKRINKPYERKTKEYKRMELALSPEEMDLIVANHGDKLTDAQIVALRDNLINQYRTIISRLEKHSNKMGDPALDNIRQRALAAIRHFMDFPKPGINFWDIMPLFKDPKLVNDICKAIANHFRSHHPEGIDVVVGLEARGFLFGPQVAIDLGVPFVPIRKKGKLPGETIQASYAKEYGLDIVEIQKDALKPGQKVVLVDDLLATGGTMNAAIQLMEKAGAKVVEAFVVVELTELKGRSVLPEGTRLVALHSD